MRLLLITRVWPTDDHPSAGSFVVDRVRDLPDVTVVGPTSYKGPWWLEYARLTVDALRTRGRFDGVEAHMLYPSGLIGLLRSRGRVPLVVVAHGTDVGRASGGSHLYRWLCRRIVAAADAVVANSAVTAGHVQALGGEAVVIPPPVDLARFRPSPRPPERRVLYLGGDPVIKGSDVAATLADTVAGPGLREFPPSEVPALIASHDVVLMPSREEGFGVLAVEAIASGRWVVASAIGGLRQIVQDGVNGTLVSDGNFAGALANVPDYEPEAIAATVQQFSIARHQAAMDALWLEVLERRRQDARPRFGGRRR